MISPPVLQCSGVSCLKFHLPVLRDFLALRRWLIEPIEVFTVLCQPPSNYLNLHSLSFVRIFCRIEVSQQLFGSSVKCNKRNGGALPRLLRKNHESPNISNTHSQQFSSLDKVYFLYSCSREEINPIEIIKCMSKPTFIKIQLYLLCIIFSYKLFFNFYIIENYNKMLST